MRILYIITQGECGGAQKNLLDSAVKMKHLGNKVFVCMGKQKEIEDKWLFEELKKQGFVDEELIILDSLRRNIAFLNDLKSWFYAYKVIKKISPHIVHLHSSKAGVVCSMPAKVSGAKVFYTVHGFVFSEKLCFVRKYLYVFLEFLSSFFIDTIITVSKYDKEIGEKYFVIRGDKGEVIYNGIDIKKKDNLLNKQDARKIILKKVVFSGVDYNIVGVIANLYKNKGINFLIDAATEICEKNKKILFIVIGEGDEKDYLSQKIISKKLKNKFLLIGAIPDAYRYLKAFDLLVLPSTKEGFPYILLESLLAQVPFIATRVGGIPEIARINDSKLVEPGNSKQLALSILQFFNKHCSIEYSFPKEFTIDFMLEQLKIGYQSASMTMIELNKKHSFLITIPAFNEEKIIKHTVAKINAYLKNNYAEIIKNGLVKICVAINGSADHTELIVKSMQKEIPYLYYTITPEKGRGRALYYTWEKAKEDVFLYVDCELAYDLADLGKMINSYISGEAYDLVVASRRVIGSVVKRHIVRVMLTEGYNRMLKMFFFNRFTDAQAGCKSITKFAYEKIKNHLENYHGWFFDTALLIYAEKKGFKIKDLTITCIDNRKWRLSVFRTVLYFFKNVILLRIKTIARG